MMQLVAQEQGQLLDLRWRDHGLGHGEAAGEIRNLLSKLVPAKPQVGQPLAHRSVLCVHQPLLDQFQQRGDASLCLLVILAHLPQPIAIAVLALDRGAQIVAEQLFQMIGLQYLLRHLRRDAQIMEAAIDPRKRIGFATPNLQLSCDRHEIVGMLVLYLAQVAGRFQK